MSQNSTIEWTPTNWFWFRCRRRRYWHADDELLQAALPTYCLEEVCAEKLRLAQLVRSALPTGRLVPERHFL